MSDTRSLPDEICRHVGFDQCRYALIRVLQVLLAFTIAFNGIATFSVAGVLPQDQMVLRRPVAMVLTDSHLLVANRDSGSISILDADTGTVINESVISNHLDDLLAVPGTDMLLAVDSESHRILVLQTSDGSKSQLQPLSVRVVNTIRPAKYPVSIVTSVDGKLVSCASKWSRRLTLLTSDSLLSNKAPVKIVDLPFVPLRQHFVNERTVLVCDAHGGELAIVDAVDGELRSWQKLIGHNIRGLVVTRMFSAQKPASPEPVVLLSHQILNAASSTTRSTISWGGVISNTLHMIPVDELLESTSTQTAEPIHGSLFPLGHEGLGAGDPSGVAVGRDGRVYVALRGVSEVAVRKPHSQQLKRVSVGRGPTQLILDENRNRLFVLSTFNDSITELDADSMVVIRNIPAGNQVSVRDSVQAGEELFFDSRLSLDGWYSCHGCHSDGHTTGQLNDNFGDESFRTPKQIPTLLGTGSTMPWTWTGSIVDLRNQVRKSIELTMAGPGKSAHTIGDPQIESLVSYLSSLQPAPGILAARDKADRPSVARGKLIFESQGCTRCHQPPGYTSPLSFDVGFRDETGQQHFNPPSLLGVSQRGPFFHDNRANRLIDVLREHDHNGASALSETEVNDLIDFLQSL